MRLSATDEFWRITLDTNPDYCNLNCIMCEDHSSYSETKASRKKSGRLRPMMSKSLLESVLRQAAALGFREVIPSTMGEPLLYPHFESILEFCHEFGLKINLTTNGTFPSPEKDKNVEYWAEHIVPIASDVKISWNGATEETHAAVMRGTKLADHISNAKRFILVRDQLEEVNYCSLTMQLTFMEINLDEIPAMVNLALELGFDRIKGHHLWVHFDQLKEQSLRRNTSAAEQWNLTVQKCQKIIRKHNVTASRPVRLDNFYELDTTCLEDIAPGGACPFLGREIWIDPTGRFNVCCAPNLQRLSLGDFGNLNNDSLLNMFKGKPYQLLTQNYMEHQLCQGCNMRRPQEKE